MPYHEPYCHWCAAERFCAKKDEPLLNLPSVAWPECYQDPVTAVKAKLVEFGENYELLF